MVCVWRSLNHWIAAEKDTLATGHANDVVASILPYIEGIRNVDFNPVSVLTLPVREVCRGHLQLWIFTLNTSQLPPAL